MYKQALIASLFLASPSFATDLQPFTDLNTILSAEKIGNTIKFTTSGGVKTLNLNTEVWSHNPATVPSISASSINLWQEWNDRGVDAESLLPDWYHKETYGRVFPKTASGTSSWLLHAPADEGAVFTAQYLIDIKGRRTLKLPMDYIFNYIVDKNRVFLLSPFGISELNLTNGERVEYWTLPIARDIQGYVKLEKTIYYLSRIYGLQKVVPDTGEVSFVHAFGPYITNGYQFSELIDYDGKLYVLAVGFGGSGKASNATSGYTCLLAYDPKSDTLEEFTTGIPYAYRLKPEGEWIYGWGHYTEYSEGGESNSYGGAFRFNTKTKEAELLSNLPISDININPLSARSIIINDSEIVITKMKYDHAEKQLIEYEKESFNMRNLGRKKFLAKYKELSTELETLKKDNSEETIKLLTGIKFITTTIKFQDPPAEIKTY